MTTVHEILTNQGLQFLEALTHPELLAPTTHSALKDTGGRGLVAKIRDEDSDTAAFFERFGLDPSLGANCVIVEGQRGDVRTLAACVALGRDRIDLNGMVRKALGSRKIRIAPQEALEQLGMESGGVSPLGLPPEWTILVDTAVEQAPELIVGSGIRESKLLLSGATIAALAGAKTLRIPRS